MTQSTTPAPPTGYVGRHRLPDDVRVEQYLTGCWHLAGETAWPQCHPTRIAALLAATSTPKAVAA